MNKQLIAIIILIFLVSFFYRLWDIDKLKYSPDEFANVGIGIRYWYNILHLDFNSDSWKKYNEHPPIGRYIYGFVNGVYYYFKEKNLTSLKLTYEEGKEFLLVKKDFVPSKIMSAIMGSLTVVITFLIGLKYFNFRIAIISSLILAFLPLFIAYTKIATLESPMVFFYTSSVYLFLLAIEKNKNIKYYSSAIIVTGLAIGTKFNNLSLLILLPLIFLLYKKFNIFNIKDKNDLIILISIILLPIAIFFITFPWLWSNLINIFLYEIHPSSEITSLYKEYFLGQITQGPFYYFFVYFLISIPALILFFFFITTYRIIKIKNFYGCILLLWVLVPLIFQSLVPLKSLGIRYVLMILPPLSILASIGFLYTLDKIKLKPLMIYIVSTLLVMYLFVTNLFIHPYYLDYYNEFTGGTKNVFNNKWFEIARWGEGISEATDYLNENARENTTVQFLVGPPTHIIPELRKDLQVVPGPEERLAIGLGRTYTEDLPNYTVDYMMVNNYFLWYYKDITENITSLYNEIYVVKVEGAPITTLYQHK